MVGADPDEGVPYKGPDIEPLDHGIPTHCLTSEPVAAKGELSRVVPDIRASIKGGRRPSYVGWRKRVTRPAEPFTWSLRAAANSSRVMPGCSAFGSRSVAIMVHV